MAALQLPPSDCGEQTWTMRTMKKRTGTEVGMQAGDVAGNCKMYVIVFRFTFFVLVVNGGLILCHSGLFCGLKTNLRSWSGFGCSCESFSSFLLLPVGCWLLGCWLLAVGCCWHCAQSINMQQNWKLTSFASCSPGPLTIGRIRHALH